MKPTPCRHCGRPIRPLPTNGHPYRHVETGKSWCRPVTKAEPVSEHRWIETTNYADTWRHEECTHCGATRTGAFP